MLIWIGKHRREDNGATHAQSCERCHNHVEYHLIRSYRMVSFNFIPLFAIGSKWRHECPVCAHGRELRGEELETQRRAALLGAAHAYARTEESALLAAAPRSQKQGAGNVADEVAGNDNGEHKSGLRIIAVVVAAIVVFVVSVAIFAPKTASSSSQSATVNALPKAAAQARAAAQAVVPRTPVRPSSARPTQRTQPRAAASAVVSSGAAPHADTTR
jgi:hypothetical protein